MDFKKFFEKVKKQDKNSLMVPSSEVLTNKVNAVLSVSPSFLSKNDAQEFSEKVSSLAVSSDVIDEFSSKIGLPKDNESEDEFVNRAKLTLKDILKKKLSN